MIWQNRLQRSKGMFFRAGFALAMSFAVLIVCSKNSFLYPMNDWVDVNCFFTVGRGITHGLVPYRDLYDQKGPLLYFVYALASLISEHGFLGVFLIEFTLFALFLYIAGRTAELLSGRNWSFWPTVAGLGLAIPLSPAFSHGGSAEEFFLPAFAGGLYVMFRAMREHRPLSTGQSVLMGSLTAAAFWTKYTFCGLFAGLAAAALVWYLAERWLKVLPMVILQAVAGFLLLSVMILAWYLWKGALRDLWQAYFVDNLTRYSQNIRGGNYADPLPNLLNNLSWFIPAALGLGGLLINIRKKWRELLAVVSGAVLLFIFTYLSGRKYPYYAMVMACFAPTGFGMLFLMCPAQFSTKKSFGRAVAALAILAVALSPAAALQWSQNVYLMNVPVEEMPPWRFAKIIRQSEDRTLLNYGFLDGGFYLAAESQPVTRFFCSLNNDLPEMVAEQRDVIAEGRVAYIITRGSGKSGGSKSGGERYLMRNYREVDSCSMIYEGRTWTYHLYERILEP